MYSTLSEQPFIQQKKTLKELIAKKQNHFRKASIFPVIIVIGYFVYSIYSIVIYAQVLAAALLDDACKSFRTHMAWIVAINVLQFLEVLLLVLSLSIRKKWILYLTLAWTALMVVFRVVLLSMLFPTSKIEQEATLCYPDAGSEKFDWQIYVVHLAVHTVFDIVIVFLLIFMLRVLGTLAELKRQLEYYNL